MTPCGGWIFGRCSLSGAISMATSACRSFRFWNLSCPITKALSAIIRRFGRSGDGRTTPGPGLPVARFFGIFIVVTGRKSQKNARFCLVFSNMNPRRKRIAGDCFIFHSTEKEAVTLPNRNLKHSMAFHQCAKLVDPMMFCGLPILFRQGKV